VDSEISLKMNWPAPKFVLALRLNLLLNNTFKTCGALAVTTEISHFFLPAAGGQFSGSICANGPPVKLVSVAE
jgi:hypothetical protein